MYQNNAQPCRAPRCTPAFVERCAPHRHQTPREERRISHKRHGNQDGAQRSILRPGAKEPGTEGITICRPNPGTRQRPNSSPAIRPLQSRATRIRRNLGGLCPRLKWSALYQIPTPGHPTRFGAKAPLAYGNSNTAAIPHKINVLKMPKAPIARIAIRAIGSWVPRGFASPASNAKRSQTMTAAPDALKPTTSRIAKARQLRAQHQQQI